MSVPAGQEGLVCEERTFTVVEDRPVRKERRTVVRMHARALLTLSGSLTWQL